MTTSKQITMDKFEQFLNITNNNLEELKREFCRLYDNWEITQNEFNGAVIATIRLNETLKALKEELIFKLGVKKDDKKEIQK